MIPTTMATILSTGLPFVAAGVAGVPAAVPDWRAPHAVQNPAPSAIGFPQLVQKLLMMSPPNDFWSKVIQLRYSF
jgi:hypothetical protein